MFQLKKKVCLITGSYGYLANTFVEDICKFDATVILSGRNKDKLDKQYQYLSKKYKNVYKICLDMTNLKDIEEKLKIIIKTHKRLDIIINNANSWNKLNKLQNKVIDDIKQSFKINCLGVFHLIKNAIPVLIETAKKYNTSPSVINFGSIYGSFSPKKQIYPNLDCVNPIEYGMAKASLTQMTKYLASYYADKNIRFNSISPGCFPDVNKVKDEEFLENLKIKCPMNKIGIPSDLSGIIIFLAGDSSSFITGQDIFIDGGATCWL